MVVKNKKFMTTSDEMQNQIIEPEVWIVDNMLRLDRMRISLLSGLPESGKSTLARQLVVAVAHGGYFLNRRCTKGEVVYWQTEDDKKDVYKSYQKLGHDRRNGDAMIHTFTGEPSDNTYKNMAEFIEEHPAVNLVIIELLANIMKQDQMNDNSGAQRAYDRFTELVVGKFNQRVSFLGLAEWNKDKDGSTGTRILGATEHRARTDTKIYLDIKKDDEEQRIIKVTTRCGVGIPWTNLVYDSEHGCSALAGC